MPSKTSTPPGEAAQEVVSSDISSIREKVIGYFNVNQDECLVHDLNRIKDDDYQINRFLVSAKEGTKEDVILDDIANDVIKTIKWRKLNNVSSLVESDFPQEYYQSGAIFTSGKDKSGSTLLILRVKVNRRISEWVDLLKKFIIFHIEKSDRESRSTSLDGKGLVDDYGHGITVIFDCSGAGISNLDLDLLSFIVSVLRDYYPLLLRHVLVVELPFVFAWVFKIVQSWLPEKHQRLMKCLNKKEIKDLIDEEQLPDFMGGTNSMSYKVVPKGALTAEEIADKIGINKKASEKLVRYLSPFL